MDRIANALTAIGARALTDPRVIEISERLQRELRQARAVGELTVLTAAQNLKSAATPPTSEAPAADVETPVVHLAPECVPDYVNLSASQIIPLLSGLSVTERAEVLAYESATRRRKTILAALGASTS